MVGVSDRQNAHALALVRSWNADRIIVVPDGAMLGRVQRAARLLEVDVRAIVRADLPAGRAFCVDADRLNDVRILPSADTLGLVVRCYVPGCPNLGTGDSTGRRLFTFGWHGERSTRRLACPTHAPTLMGLA